MAFQKYANTSLAQMSRIGMSSASGIKTSLKLWPPLEKDKTKSTTF
jgi:hypothetical protein